MDLKYYFAYMSFNLYHICCIQHFMLFSFSFFWQFLCENIFTFFKRIFRGKLTLMMKKSQEKTQRLMH